MDCSVLGSILGFPCSGNLPWGFQGTTKGI